MVDHQSYSPWDVYNSDARVKAVMDSLFSGPWSKGNPDCFRMIFDEIMNHNDPFFVLADFGAYMDACQRADELYSNPMAWARASLINIASSGYFTSDRTIEEYNRDIWNLKRLEVEEKE